MANAKFLAVDLSKYVTLSTSVAEDPSNPLANLRTYYAVDQWVSTSTASQTLKIDFSSAVACDTVVLQNHTMASLSLTSANLEYSSDNTNWTAAVDLKTIGNPGWVEFTQQTMRYWRINFIITGGAIAPAIGNWFLGSRFDPGFPYNFPFKAGNRKYQTGEGIALDGRLRMTQAFAGRQTWEIDFSALSDATRGNFQTLFKTTRGKLRPLYLLDTDGSTIGYVHFDLDYDPSQGIRYNVNDIKKIVLKTQLVS